MSSSRRDGFFFPDQILFNSSCPITWLKPQETPGRSSILKSPLPLALSHLLSKQCPTVNHSLNTNLFSKHWRYTVYKAMFKDQNLIRWTVVSHYKRQFIVSILFLLNSIIAIVPSYYWKRTNFLAGCQDPLRHHKDN